MQADNWKKMKNLLDEVLQLKSSERKLFIQRSGCSREICAEVESLLAFEDQAENLINLSALEFSKDFFEQDTSSNSFIGQQIGVYRVIRELGIGGMGAVYLAERNDGKIEQNAAIKMLKREFNVEKLRHSFKREIAILAKLNHPNIAHLFDAGTTDDGIPYLIMEYVEGNTIDKFCEINNLSLKVRLKLFNKVCEAVSFAHQNLIIHRDLKPSNILVTSMGEVKLLDFGISKILNEEHSEKTNTVTLLGAMTPEYASPEQIRNEKITTASDIYSLGVVLYKILTGTLPYNFEGKTNGNLLKIVTETEPSMPSSQNTNPDSAIRNPQLKGDIDNIILKSLRKEPERRYKTVEQFSADIWRFIDGLPILARPATISYQASKFFKRNKIAVIAGILIFFSLIAGITVAIRQTGIAREQARVAAESQNLAITETQKAKSEQLKAEKITRFMTKIIGYANPVWYAEGAKFGKDARVIDAIIDLSQKIDDEFAAEPDVAAELHHRFLEVLLPNPGSLTPEEQKARKLFHARRALELRKQFYGEKHELVAKDMVYLYWANGVEKSEKAKYLMEAIQMMRETNPSNLNLPYMLEDYTARMMLPTEGSHEAYRNAVFPPTEENKYQVADRMLREALSVWQLHYPPDHPVILSKNCWLAYALAKQDNWAEFNEPYQLCKQIETKRRNGKLSTASMSSVELVEKVLKEKKVRY